MTRARERFAELCQQDPPPLDQACAWLAADEHPGVDPDDLLAQLDVLAEGLWVPDDASSAECAARLTYHFAQQWGFDGDHEDYEAPENSCLDTVLARRRGLPILLSIVLMEVSRRADIRVDGIGFPGHFLVALHDADPPFFLDPFNGCRVLRRADLVQRLQRMAPGGVPGDPDRFFRPVPNRYILVRVCNNLKGTHLRAGEVEGVLRSVERLLLLDEGLIEERRDRGLILHHLGRLDEAVPELETYLEARPDAPDQARIQEILDQISG